MKIFLKETEKLCKLGFYKGVVLVNDLHLPLLYQRKHICWFLIDTRQVNKTITIKLFPLPKINDMIKMKSFQFP